MEKIPAHPLVIDEKTGLCRYITQDDVRRFERIETNYNNLIAQMKEAIRMQEYGYLNRDENKV